MQLRQFNLQAARELLDRVNANIQNSTSSSSSSSSSSNNGSASRAGNSSGWFSAATSSSGSSSGSRVNRPTWSHSSIGQTLDSGATTSSSSNSSSSSIAAKTWIQNQGVQQQQQTMQEVEEKQQQQLPTSAQQQQGKEQQQEEQQQQQEKEQQQQDQPSSAALQQLEAAVTAAAAATSAAGDLLAAQINAETAGNADPLPAAAATLGPLGDGGSGEPWVPAVMASAAMYARMGQLDKAQQLYDAALMQEPRDTKVGMDVLLQGPLRQLDKLLGICITRIYGGLLVMGATAVSVAPANVASIGQTTAGAFQVAGTAMS